MRDLLLLDKKKAFVILILILLFQMWCYHYSGILKVQPRSIHSWRQTDCLSFAESFYNDRGTFTEPCVNNLGSTGDGKIASDFPIVQYTIGKLWKWTGISPQLFRLVELTFLLMGLYFIYRLFLFWSRNSYWLSILGTALIFTSPILSYYGFTFLSDVQAFGLSCGGFYFFIRWLDSRKYKHLIYAMLFVMFAGLLKMSSGFVFLVSLSLLALTVLQQRKDKTALKQLLNLKTLPTLLLPFLAWYLWYSHAAHYNQQHPNGFFLIGILPIWGIDFEQKHFILMKLVTEIIPQMLAPSVLIMMVTFASAYVFSNLRQLFSFNSLVLIVCGGAYLAFVLLFYQVFDVHDYYMLNMMALVAIVLGMLLKIVAEHYPRLLQFRGSIIFMALLVLLFTYTTAIKTRGRMNFNDNWGKKSLVYDSQQYEFIKWNTWYEDTRYGILEDPAFRPEHLGIAQNDTVFCLGDKTINRSLYLMNRVGYTSFNVDVNDAPAFIHEQMKHGLKYLVLIEPDWQNNEGLQPYMKWKIFQKDGTSIYRLK